MGKLNQSSWSKRPTKKRNPPNPPGRRPIFIAHRATKQDAVFIEGMRTEVADRRKNQETEWDRFAETCKLNGWNPLAAQSITDYAGLLQATPMMPGSILTNVSYLVSERSARLNPEKRMLEDTVAILKLKAGAQPGKHARDECFENLCRVYRLLTPKDRTIFMLLLCGFRFAAIALKTWNHLIIQGDVLHVEINVDKNHRGPADRDISKVPIGMLPQPLAFMNSKRGEGKLCEPNYYPTFSAHIKQAAQRVGIPPITTYTLKRNYIQRVIRECTLEGDVEPDWKKVRERTKHLQEKTVKAFYQKYPTDK
jgi:integrase